ncbi:MAG: LysM peptidoglycan-binding domain-containing protein [Verrucomicrobia bacterium]|nr:LysM peptidoglycan-binding domain-containing protein [Kiritimatiellia bacterium]MCP5487267.1 LysM peptidoglycan-binding domain-containing protein [Verrucomicrobiota bacterium]
MNRLNRMAGMALLLGVALGTSGCLVNPRDQQIAAEQARQDMLYYQESIRILKAKTETLEQEVYRLRQDLNSSGTTQSRVIQGQLDGLNTALEDLNRRIGSVDAARQADKKQMVDELSRQISALLAAQQSQSRSRPASTRSFSGEGYEHVVQAGETLSAIATAYGVRVSDIVEASNLSSPDQLRVGQKLFIPAR